MRNNFYCFARFLSMLAVVLGSLVHCVLAQEVGDYGSSGNMNWNGGLWHVCSTPGTWAGASTSTTAPTSATNVWIAAGHTVTLTTVNGVCKNLFVAGTLNTAMQLNVNGSADVASNATISLGANSYWGVLGTAAVPTHINVATGGTLVANNNAAYRFFLQGKSLTITNNGIFGFATNTAGRGSNFTVNDNCDLTITGSGVTNLFAISADRFSPRANIVIDLDIALTRADGNAALTLQPWGADAAAGNTRTLTINEGKTVTLRSGGWWHYNGAFAPGLMTNNIYNINGTLDASAGSINLVTASNTETGDRGTTNSLIVNVGASGTLKCGSVIYVAKLQPAQSINVNVAAGGAITYAGTAYDASFSQSQTINNALLTATNHHVGFTGGAAISVAMGANIIVNGDLLMSNTVTFNGSNNITLKGNSMGAGSINVTGSGSVLCNGTTRQTLTVGNVANLIVDNPAGVSAAPSITGLLTLTAGGLSDYSNAANCSVLLNGSAAQTFDGPASVNHLTINNTAGVQLNTALTVNGLLSLINGRLTTGNNNIVLWPGASVSTSAPGNAYIATTGTGILKYAAQAGVAVQLPIGTAVSYNPLTLKPTGPTDFYVNVSEGNSPLLSTINGTLDINKTLNRTWHITATTPTATEVSIGYAGNTDANNGFDNSGADVALLHYGSNGWEYAGSGAVIPGANAGGYRSAVFSDISSFSPFTLANPGAGAMYTGGGSNNTFSDLYRSAGNGIWGNAATWELFDNASASWTSTVTTPSISSTVTVRTGHTVTINAQAGVGTLTIENGATLQSTVNAYQAAPIILSVGKPASVIRNNGIFGCVNGSDPATGGDGISIAIANNCTSFSLQGIGTTGIGSLYAIAGSNDLTAIIDMDVQFRYSAATAAKTALTMVDITNAAFTGSRTLTINANKTVSFLNNNSCLHGTAFSTAGSYPSQQGNIMYDIQGTLDMKGGNVFITSSSSPLSANQFIKLQIGAAGKVVANGSFSWAKIQASQSVYVNIENGGLLDASLAPLNKANVFGPSTNSTPGFGGNYVWVVMNGINATYKRLCGQGGNVKVFNVAVPPAGGNYAAIKGNPVSISTFIGNTSDIYTVGIAAGINPSLVSRSPDYAINRTWKIVPGRSRPYGTQLKFGFTGQSEDANPLYSTSFPSYADYSGAAIPAGATDLYTYNGTTSRWVVLSWQNKKVPVAGTLGTDWQMEFNSTAAFTSPYHFTFLHQGAPLICQ